MNKIKIQKLIGKISKFFKRFFSNSNNSELKEEVVHRKIIKPVQKGYSYPLYSQTYGLEDDKDSYIELDTPKKNNNIEFVDTFEDSSFKKTGFQLKSSESSNGNLSEKSKDEEEFKEPIIEKDGDLVSLSCSGDYRLVSKGKKGENRFICIAETYLDNRFINLLNENISPHSQLDDENIKNMINEFIKYYNYPKKRAKKLYEDYIQRKRIF